MGRSTDKETRLSEQRKYRTWTARQKIAIVLAGLRGDRSVKEVCREHQISDTLYYSWRDKLLEGGLEAPAGKEERQGERELRRRVAELERALGRKQSAGGLSVARTCRPLDGFPLQTGYFRLSGFASACGGSTPPGALSIPSPLVPGASGASA